MCLYCACKWRMCVVDSWFHWLLNCPHFTAERASLFRSKYLQQYSMKINLLTTCERDALVILRRCLSYKTSFRALARFMNIARRKRYDYHHSIHGSDPEAYATKGRRFLRHKLPLFSFKMRSHVCNDTMSFIARLPRPRISEIWQ